MANVKTFSFSKGVVKKVGDEILIINGKKAKFRHYILVLDDVKRGGKVLAGLWISDDGRFMIPGKKSGDSLQPSEFMIELKKPLKTDQDLKQALNLLARKPTAKEKASESALAEASPATLEAGLKAGGTIMGLQVLQIITAALVSIYLFFRYYGKKIQKIALRRESMTAEDDLNRMLFQGQTGQEPEFAVYGEMSSAIYAVLSGKRVGIIIGGPPGTGKTYAVRRLLYFSGLKSGSDYMYVKGSGVTIDDVYQLLYEFRNKILLMDDFDSPLRDPEMRNLLKSATDSYPVRIVNRPQSGELSTQYASEKEAPDRFKYNGRIIIITNLPEEEIEPALLSRMGYINVDFPADEMIKIVGSMLKYLRPEVPIDVKKEVLDFLAAFRAKHKGYRIDFRVYMNALDLRLAFPNNWKKIVLKTLTREYQKGQGQK